MSETTKTYVFPDSGNSGGMLGLLAPLMQRNGLDPNLLLAMNRNGGFGGEGGWFIWVIFLFFLMGWGRNGWGGFGGNDSNGCAAGLAGLVNNDNGRELLMSAIQGNGNAIGQLASSLNCSVQQVQSALCALQGQVAQVGNQVGMSGQQIINAVQAGNTQLAQQLAQCCCDQRLATCQQTNTLQNTMNGGFQMLRDSNAANTNAILGKLDGMETRALQDKIEALREKNTALTAQLNNEHQTAAIMQSQAQMIQPLAREVEAIKCKLPNTVTVPYSEATAVPNCIAYGLFGYPYAAGGWG